MTRIIDTPEDVLMRNGILIGKATDEKEFTRLANILKREGHAVVLEQPAFLPGGKLGTVKVHHYSESCEHETCRQRRAERSSGSPK